MARSCNVYAEMTTGRPHNCLWLASVLSTGQKSLNEVTSEATVFSTTWNITTYLNNVQENSSPELKFEILIALKMKTMTHVFWKSLVINVDTKRSNYKYQNSPRAYFFPKSILYKSRLQGYNCSLTKTGNQFCSQTPKQLPALKRTDAVGYCFQVHLTDWHSEQTITNLKDWVNKPNTHIVDVDIHFSFVYLFFPFSSAINLRSSIMLLWASYVMPVHSTALYISNSSSWDTFLLENTARNIKRKARCSTNLTACNNIQILFALSRATVC
jgi:hypothetical protein